MCAVYKHTRKASYYCYCPANVPLHRSVFSTGNEKIKNSQPHVTVATGGRPAVRGGPRRAPITTSGFSAGPGPRSIFRPHRLSVGPRRVKSNSSNHNRSYSGQRIPKFQFSSIFADVSRFFFLYFLDIFSSSPID